MRLLRQEEGDTEEECTILGETQVDSIIRYARELNPRPTGSGLDTDHIL